MSKDEQDAVIYQVTDSHMKRLVNEVLTEFAKEHACKFSAEERYHVHALAEVMKEEGANHGTLRVLIQWGVSLTDITKQVKKWSLLIFGGILLLIGGHILAKHLMK